MDVGRGAENGGHVPHKDSNVIVATKINPKRRAEIPRRGREAGVRAIDCQISDRAPNVARYTHDREDARVARLPAAGSSRCR
jgi:hypothetical protein